MRYLKFSALYLGLLLGGFSCAAAAAPEDFSEKEKPTSNYYLDEPPPGHLAEQDGGVARNEFIAGQDEVDAGQDDEVDAGQDRGNKGKDLYHPAPQCRMPWFKQVCEDFRTRQLGKLKEELRKQPGEQATLEIWTSLHFIGFLNYVSILAKIHTPTDYGGIERRYRTFNYDLGTGRPVDSFYKHIDDGFYSETELFLDKKCNDYKDQCDNFAKYQASSFDSEVIKQQQKSAEDAYSGYEFAPDQADSFDSTDGKQQQESADADPGTEGAPDSADYLWVEGKDAYQAVISRVDIIESGELKFAAIISNFDQYIGNDQKHDLRVSNFNLLTHTPVLFRDLFEKPQLAARLCADRIKQIFAPYKMSSLDLVAAAVAADPRNFMLRPDGIQMIFPANTVTPQSLAEREGRVPPVNRSEIVTICVEDLKSAGIKKEWKAWFTPPQQPPESVQPYGAAGGPGPRGPERIRSCRLKVEQEECARCTRLEGREECIRSQKCSALPETENGGRERRRTGPRRNPPPPLQSRAR